MGAPVGQILGPTTLASLLFALLDVSSLDTALDIKVLSVLKSLLAVSIFHEMLFLMNLSFRLLSYIPMLGLFSEKKYCFSQIIFKILLMGA